MARHVELDRFAQCEAPTMAENEYGPPAENPYAAPASVPIDPRSSPAETAEIEHLRAFVGSQADYYLEKWLPLGKRGSCGFNWAAFLLSGLWLPYRKMYRATAIFFGIILVESIAEEVLFVGVLGEEAAPTAFGQLFGLVVAIICGASANSWYLSHARKVLAEVRAQGFEEYALAESLSKRGGTSIVASLGFFFLFIVITFAVLIFLDLLLYSA
jgi:hypothetical protein